MKQHSTLTNWIVVASCNQPCGGLLSQFIAYVTGHAMDVAGSEAAEIFRRQNTSFDATRSMVLSKEFNILNPDAGRPCTTYDAGYYSQAAPKSLPFKSLESAFYDRQVALFFKNEPTSEQIKILKKRVGSFFQACQQHSLNILVPDKSLAMFSDVILLKQSFEMRTKIASLNEAKNLD